MVMMFIEGMQVGADVLREEGRGLLSCFLLPLRLLRRRVELVVIIVLFSVRPFPACDNWGYVRPGRLCNENGFLTYSAFIPVLMKSELSI